VTILPAGQTLGVTEQLPLVERHMYSEDYLLDSLAVRLGGRAAELVVIGQGSTGASNDLAGATDLAVKMVREFGLSKTLGPIGYPEGGSVFLGGGGAPMSSRPFAEATQAEIDNEVSRLLREAEQRAIELLKGHRPQLDSLVSLLLEVETVDGTDVYRLAGRPDVSHSVPSVPPIIPATPRAAAVSDGGTRTMPAADATAPLNTDRPGSLYRTDRGSTRRPPSGRRVLHVAGRVASPIWLRWPTSPARRSTVFTSGRCSCTSMPWRTWSGSPSRSS
jgi:cell division protease FtsH